MLKPGLNEVVEKEIKKYTNNVVSIQLCFVREFRFELLICFQAGLKRKVADFKLNLPWLETLDLINTPAPLAPEMAVQLQEQEDKRANQIKNNKKLPQIKPVDDPVLNDFKREMLFHRQAQSAVLEGIAKLKKLGIKTKRPDDFFAEMAKTDEQMQKIRENLVKKQAEAQRSERVKQLRAQRKMGKTLQIQAKLQKAADKKEMLDQVKKYRKGMKKDLSFLNDNKGGKPQNGIVKSKKAIEKEKRKMAKFGFGGKKKGSKLNTKDSSADVSDYKMPGKPNLKRGANKSFKSKGGPAKRPGKNRRQKMKNKGKK